MKLEQLIVHYLYSNKSVTLQDIGTFHLAPEIAIPHDSDKDYVLPDNAIRFEFNRKAETDEGLVDFIVQQTRKIKPLAKSDLESYSNLNKQFLNIGKPLYIEGLGTLLKNQSGDYIFSQTDHFRGITESKEPKIKIQETVDEEIDFSSTLQDAPTQKNKVWLPILLVVFLIAGATALYFYFQKDKNKEVVQEQVQPEEELHDTSHTAVAIPIDSSITAPSVPGSDGYTFKVVLKEYPSLATAQRRLKTLQNYGHNPILVTKDSVRYTLQFPFTTPLSDTTRAMDSLNRFFGAKTRIELK